MKIKILRIIFFLPVLFFTLGAFMPFVALKVQTANTKPMLETSLMYNDFSMIGTSPLFSFMFGFLALSIFGIIFLFDSQTSKHKIGFTLYSIAFIFGFLIVYYFSNIVFADDLLLTANQAGLGLTLGYFSTILGLILVVAVYVAPATQVFIRSQMSAPFSYDDGNLNQTPDFKDFAEWKKLNLSGVINDEEYRTIKTELINKIKKPKTNQAGFLKANKKALDEGIIDEVDFDVLKKKTLE